MANEKDWRGVCPVNAPVRNHDISAVLANSVLPNNLGVTISPPGPVGTMHVGGPLNPAGGTLIHNKRNTTVSGMTQDLNGSGAQVNVTHQGPLHDPTSILYVRTADLDANGKLLPTAPVEPLVLRALPGECITVTLRNRLPPVRQAATGGGGFGSEVGSAWETTAIVTNTATINSLDGSGASINGMDGVDAQGQPLSPLSTSLMPDLASFTILQGTVKRDRFHPEGATTFNHNLIRPSTHAGLHPQLVAFDVTRHDGMPVGRNRPNEQFATPGATTTYQWYAGDIGGRPANGLVTLVGTPIEFGGVNLLPADKIKQGAKSMVGQLVIEPAGSTWSEATQIADRQGGTGKRLTRAQATVTAGSTSFRDFSLVLTKAMTQYYRDGHPVENINPLGGQSVPEDSPDSSNMALNYGIEPLWFRFGLLPSAPFGSAGTPGSYGAVANAHKAYSNTLLTPSVTCGADKLCTGDPETPVMFATPGQASRVRITAPYGTKRGSTFALHGHLWQREPYVCPGESRNSLTGACQMGSVASRAIGNNPVGFWEAGRDSWSGTSHFDIVLPAAGGAQPVAGDYLSRDAASYGNASGVWSILRVK